MSEPVDIIDAIDRATGCQQCGRDLFRSVSDDFCSEDCQQEWSANRFGAAVDADSVLGTEAVTAWGVSAEAAGLALRQFGMSLGDLLVHVERLTRRS